MTADEQAFATEPPLHPGPPIHLDAVTAYNSVLDDVRHLAARDAVAVLVRAITFIAYDEGKQAAQTRRGHHDAVQTIRRD